ncbi:MAG: hypothetical protein U1E65_15875 [Myxococcota bacterium]
MSSLALLASLLLPASPTPGTYYRPAFALAVKHGSFDPDTYGDHREPSLRWAPPKLIRDLGQEVEAAELRWTNTGSSAAVEMRSEASGEWRPCRLRVVAPDRIETDLIGGHLETWVRLPEDFEGLAKRARAQRTAARKKQLLGAYKAEDGALVRLEARVPFELMRCYQGCQRDAARWCVSLKNDTWLIDDANQTLTETAGPEGVCPDGRAFEPKKGARIFRRSP